MIILSNDRRFDAAGARLPSPRQGHDASAELLVQPQVLDRITAALVGALTITQGVPSDVDWTRAKPMP